jgi:hypothetical protein
MVLRLAGADASGFDSVQASFFIGWLSRRRIQSSASLRLLVSGALVLSRAYIPQRASATSGLFSSIPAFSLQHDMRPWNSSL